MTAVVPPRVLLIGATGYVGGRLVGLLEADGVRLRCMARNPRRLRGRVSPSTEVVRADLLDAATLPAALDGIDVVYYLAHSMADDGDFVARERRGATNLAAAARAAGCRRIIYLGGLAQARELSAHLRSRQEVGRILAASGVQTIELRASVIIGSGSLSFALVRSLTTRLPIMLTPRWVDMETQPIAIEDVLAYLQAALDVDVEGSRVFEIGAPDRVSYRELMLEYARQRGLRRVMIRVPLLTPRLSGLWLGLVTPVYARVARKLIDGICNETVVRDSSALDAFPVRPRTVREAIARALEFEDTLWAETRWSDALPGTATPRSPDEARGGNRLVDSRSLHVEAAPQAAFSAIQRIGGRTGWYFADFLWTLRGLVDVLVGGVGLRRGRRHPEEIRVGDALDWWRVQEIDPPHLLRLFAEMKVPGRAWLQFEVNDDRHGGATICQTAIFDPAGIAGFLYWYAIYPVHAIVFRGLIRGVARRARELQQMELH